MRDGPEVLHLKELGVYIIRKRSSAFFAQSRG